MMMTTTTNLIKISLFLVITVTNGINHGWAFSVRSQSPSISNVSCPTHFVQYDDQNICYFLTDETPFPPKCPYEDVLPFHVYENIIDLFQLGPVWIPVRRDKSNGVGLMTWTEKSSKFGLAYDDFEYSVNEPHFSYMDNDCVLYHNATTRRAVPCREKNRGICAYYLFGFKKEPNKLCSFSSNVVCRQSTFDANSPCICTDYDLSGNEIQMIQAEFIQSYQNQIYNDLTSNDCLIGLERQQREKFIWARSRQELTYNDWWRHGVDFDDPDGQFIVATSSGWNILQTLDNISCSLYETPTYNQVTPKLDLKLVSNDDYLLDIFTLTISGSKMLKWEDENNLQVFCFTNSFDLIYKYEIHIVQTDDDDEISYEFQPGLRKGPGYYWCNSFAYPDLKIITSQVVFYTNSLYDFELIGIFQWNYTEGSNPMKNSYEIVKTIIQNALQNQIPDYVIRLTKVLVVDETTHQLYFNAHFTRLKTAGTSSNIITDEIGRLVELIKSYENVAEINVSLKKMLSVDFCLPEISKNEVYLTWDLTEAGSATYPKEYCFTPGGLRLKRLCSGNFIDGASWSVIKESCKIPENSKITDILTDTVMSDKSANEILDTILDLCEHHGEIITPIDIYLISELLEKIQHDDVNLKCLAEVLSDLQRIDTTVLSQSQREMNATNRILYFVDAIIKNCNLTEDGYHFEVNSAQTMIILSKVKKSNMTGLVLNLDNSLSILNETYDVIKEFVENRSIDSALIFNSKLLNQISDGDDRLNIIIYYTPALFNGDQTGSMNNMRTKIYGVQLPEIGNYEGPISILYNSTKSEKGDCVFWKIGRKVEGSWFKDDERSVISNLSLCDFNHTTHFGLLISDAMITDDEFHMLDLITNINCGLSLIGLCCILLTGILFKRWRLNTGNQILVNFALALSLQIASFYISNIVFADSSKTDILFCTIIGMILHYAIISQFCWMFVIAVLQFKRFVDVFGGPPKHVLVKACFCGWILPLFPVFCVWFLDHNNYVSGNVGLCYPSGFGLYLGVWLPIALIVFINFVIFVYIIYSVVHTKTECVDTINTEVLFQVRLAILLFFMLGLTWTFGFLSEWDFGRVFTYVFCFTATLQGFIMFAFFIVFNKNTRSMYAHGIKQLCARNKYY